MKVINLLHSNAMTTPQIIPSQRIPLEVFEAAADQLDALPDRSPLDLSPRQVIVGLYDRLAALRDDRHYTYVQLAEELERILGLALSPATLKSYMRLARIQLDRPVRKQGRKRTAVPTVAKTQSQHSQSSSAPPATKPQSFAVEAQDVIPATDSSQSVTAIPPVSPRVVAKSVNQRRSTTTMMPDRGFTPEELEMALVIPDPQDAVAVDRFLQALRYIDDVDPARWRKLAAQARNAGINILGTIAIPAQRMNQLYNEY
jgi:hypothetical protein